MRSIARRTAVGAALLLVMPVAVWISGWRWQPGEQSWLLKAAFWGVEFYSNFNGDINTTYKHGCELQRKRIECAIMIKAALAEEEG